MEAKAKLKTYRQSPRKVRLLAREIAGKSVDEARANLSITPKRVAPIMLKLLKSAEANARDRKIETDDLFIKRVWVDEGPTLFRMMPRAFGRAFVIRKRTSHINIVLASKGGENDLERKEKGSKGKEGVKNEKQSKEGSDIKNSKKISNKKAAKAS